MVSSFGVKWSYGSLYVLALVFSCLYGASGYQILPISEIMNKAMFINDYDDGYTPLILSAKYQIGPTEQLLFPFMNFTCSGGLTRLMFVASRQREPNQNVITSWPVFSLWHTDEDYRNFGLNINPLNRNKITSLQPPSISSIGDREVEVVMINFASPVSFVAGDILGLRQHDRSQNTPSTGTFWPVVSDYSIKVLRQNEGYGLALTCDEVTCPIDVNGAQEMPYIAIETTPTNQQCTSGFLNDQTLRMIVEAPRNMYDNDSFSFPGIPHQAMSMPLTRSGALRKILIAAKFDIRVPVGWPELQIIRMANNGTYNVVFTTNATEPKPTGYLNLYEYDLALKNFDIKYGDKLNISWYGNVLLRDQIRFSLAYYNNGMYSVPMVSIVVGDCDPETDLLTLNTLYCEEVTIITTSTTASTNQISNSDEIIIISGVVAFSLALLITLLIFLVVFTFVVKQRRKSASMNVTDPIEMSAQPRMLHNINAPSNGRGPTLENDYLESDDRAPSSDSAPASAIPVAMAQQQDDYYYYKLYEWGVFVPTANQRGKLASSGANNDDSVYSTLGESQYSKLQQFNKGPEFFENTDNYWKPASDTEGLYQQLSSKKYREILRQQIQLSDSLGSGQFGNVMKGVWLLSGGSKEVAVKMLKEEASETEKVRFLQEAAINGQFHHPNVVKLMGVVTIGEPVMIVLEFLSNGDLRGYLMKIQPTPGEMAPSNTPHTLLRFCKEIAAGMKYLAGKNFIHRDLAARNILVSEEKTCKISDFGMSRDLEDESYYISHGGVIPVKWTAPEALHYKKYSSLSDVWSFGCVVYEIWSLGHKPFEGYSKHEVIRKVDGGFRLSPPPGCPRDIYHIMIQCWHPNKNLRPSFSDLHTSLSDHTLSLGMKEESQIVAERPDQTLPLPLHPQAHTIGAPLETGKELYNDLQKTYINE